MKFCANDAALNNTEIARTAKMVKICWTLYFICSFRLQHASLATQEDEIQRDVAVLSDRHLSH